MEKEKVVNKGYTLKIVSWENDADNYETIFKTVETLKEAKKIKNFCEVLLNSSNDSETGVANTISEGPRDRSKVVRRLKNFIADTPEFSDWLEEAEDDDQLIQWAAEYAEEFAGYSDWYFFRVCESCTVTFSPEDIYVEKITF